jgi:DNA-binding MarR family transcriptional regulator
LFVLTNNDPCSYLGGMTLDRTIRQVQVAFPQIYFACHTRHRRRRTSAHRISPRDSTILAHLSRQTPTTPARLAEHLGVARSTLSEALKRLIALGLVERPSARTAGVRLSAKGADAIQNDSVLESDRLRAALELLSTAEQRLVARGLSTLADACRQLVPSKAGVRRSVETER